MERLNRSIEWRKEGKQVESNKLLVELVKEYPMDAIVNYQCAWSYDLLGEESKAVPYYEDAIKLGLSGQDLEGAFIGLGSTFRALGEYEKSKQVFQKGISQFPNNQVLQVFYSMTLYNLDEHQNAMQILLKCLLDNTQDEEILNYKNAISFYSDKLDRVWT
ncbi:tetratricopeptide repeat protein [Cytobacillus dafuensis]